MVLYLVLGQVSRPELQQFLSQQVRITQTANRIGLIYIYTIKTQGDIETDVEKNTSTITRRSRSSSGIPRPYTSIGGIDRFFVSCITSPTYIYIYH